MRRSLSAWILLLAMPAAPSCAVDRSSRTEERGRQVDPLVRERTLGRMDDIAKPARTSAEGLREAVAANKCGSVCPSVPDICSRADRVCELAQDYPPGDQDIHERCDWVSSDCDEARGLCANCGGPTTTHEY